MSEESSIQYDKVLVRKAKIIERCVNRAREEYALADGAFLSNYSHQDAAILNIQRACEATLDMAQRVVSQQKWGMAESSKDLFDILKRHAVIDERMKTILSHMVGFRNIAVHDYEDLNIRIVESIIKNDVSDLLAFSELVLKHFFEGKKT
jgi:uncharacterized protein YutE (UPF0331/DUF86 family)